MDNHYRKRHFLTHFEPNIASIVQKFRPSIFLSLASENLFYILEKKQIKQLTRKWADRP